MDPTTNQPPAAPQPITIQGIRIESLKIERSEPTGEDIITASYSLISSTGRVLAKQSIGDYSGMKLQPSASTLKAFGAAIAAYKNDVNSDLGLA